MNDVATALLSGRVCIMCAPAYICIFRWPLIDTGIISGRPIVASIGGQQFSFTALSGI